jgi:hypothetical protein
MNPPKGAKYYFNQFDYVLSLESLHFLAKRYSMSLSVLGMQGLIAKLAPLRSAFLYLILLGNLYLSNVCLFTRKNSDSLMPYRNWPSEKGQWSYKQKCYMRSSFVFLLSCTGLCTCSRHRYMKISFANGARPEKNRHRKSPCCIEMLAAAAHKHQPLIGSWNDRLILKCLWGHIALRGQDNCFVHGQGC